MGPTTCTEAAQERERTVTTLRQPEWTRTTRFGWQPPPRSGYLRHQETPPFPLRMQPCNRWE